MEQFFNEQPIAERETRKPLIVPAVFAIISALLMLILWGINAGMILKQNNSLLYNEAVIEFLPMTTDILLFLFCLIQYKKGKTSLFSVGSMILVITYAIGLVSLLTISEFKINSNILFYLNWSNFRIPCV